MKQNYNIEFNINKAPPSDADITAVLVRLEKPSTLFKRLAGLLAAATIFSIFLIYLCPAVFLLGVGGIMDITPIEWVTSPLALNLSTILLFALVISVLAFAGLGIQDDIQRLSAVDSAACAHIINLCALYPQIEAYRLTVTKERQIINADYDAMKNFLSEQSQLEYAANQQANIDAVQSQAPVTRTTN